jgi:hypothetical protein
MTSYLLPTTSVHLFQGEIPNDLYERLQNSTDHHNLVFIDDMPHEAMNSLAVNQLFISGRHKKATTFLSTQNLFPAGTKYARNISLNANFIVLFSSRDKTQIKALSQQMLGTNKNGFLQAAYEDAVKKHGYLLIDCSPQQKVEELRFRTNVINGATIVYIPKN